MKKISITLFIAITAFVSFGFVLLSDHNSKNVEIENIKVSEQTNELQPIQESNEDIW